MKPPPSQQTAASMTLANLNEERETIDICLGKKRGVLQNSASDMAKDRSHFAHDRSTVLKLCKGKGSLHFQEMT